MNSKQLFRDFLPENPAARLYGPGSVCQTLQILPADMRALMKAAGVKFTVVIDAVPYLDGEGFQRVFDEKQRQLGNLHDTIETEAAKN